MTGTASYNDRLFSRPGLRSFIHNARFNWVRRTLGSLSPTEFKVVELGCFDGRLLGFFPYPPARYEGFDAGWEGGLDDAQRKFAGHERWRFHLATEPAQLRVLEDKCCNIGVSLETLEHVPPELVGPYLDELSRIIDGHILITVPNEKGIVFLFKWLAKRSVLGGVQHYTFRELVAATLGRLDQIERDDHKGFDYEALTAEVASRFEIVCVSGVTISWLPTWMSLTVGILARSKGIAANR